MSDQSHDPNATPEPAAAPGPRMETPGGDPALRERVIEAIKTCYDPEIPVNIWELGLVYEVDARPEGEVQVKMTLTSPMCPVAESLPPEVEDKIRGVDGVAQATVEVTWEPPWNPGMMSEAAKLELNMM